MQCTVIVFTEAETFFIPYLEVLNFGFTWHCGKAETFNLLFIYLLVGYAFHILLFFFFWLLCCFVAGQVLVMEMI